MAAHCKKISCIVAMATNRGIGNDGKIPWRLRSELAYFKRITSTVKDIEKRNAVIMGRKTWESIPAKFRPLPGRLNIILSKTISTAPEGVVVCSDIQQAINMLSKQPYDESIEEVFVIGGNTAYKEAMESPRIHRIYLTRVHLDVDCDVFFPEFDENKFNIISTPDIPTDIQEEKGIKFQYFIYERKDDV